MIQMLPTSYRFTPVPDFFIMESMSKMSSTVIKVYLFLLYQFHQGYEYLDLDEIADRLNLTESDIFRAIQHLTKEKLLRADRKDGQYCSLALPETPVADPSASASHFAVQKVAFSVPTGTVPAAPAIPNDKTAFSETDNRSEISDSSPSTESLPAQEAEVPAPAQAERRPVYTAELIEDFAKNKDGDQLIFYTQTLLKKNLTPNDLHILFGLKDWLKMSDTLIYFLIEYCAERNHTHLSYIEKIAIDWHEKHIETVEQAKDYLASYPSYYYTVLKAYGIYNLAPIPAQMKMIDKWLKEYRLPMDLIVYACEKTILQTGKPELNYTDSILKTWKDKQLLSREQVDRAEADKPKKAPASVNSGRGSKSGNAIKTTTFNNYTQRQEDYDAIEKKAFTMRIQKKESEQ